MTRLKDFLGGTPEHSFRLIVHFYQDKVIRFISLFVQNSQECEELASDVFLSLWKNQQKLEEIEDLDSYIFIMYKIIALNHL